MRKILFVCHGNICRSPLAEYLFRDLVSKRGLEKEFLVASAATTYEEIGNPVYPPIKALLQKEGIDCSSKRARRIEQSDYLNFDLLIAMDSENENDMLDFFKGDKEDKIHLLLDYSAKRGEIFDPWYTRDFQKCYRQIKEGCEGLLAFLTA